MSEPTLVTESLGLRITGIDIVRDVSMRVAAGEFVGIIGPNGAGKTSLLNLLTGTSRATSGTVHLLGYDVTRMSPNRRARHGLARTFQTSYLLLGLSVRENVRLALQSKNTSVVGLLRVVGKNDATRTRSMEILDSVGLTDAELQTAGSLSHGDRRKLELAFVLASEAPVVLLDEPMAGVNAEDVDDLMELIRGIHEQQKTTILMVEHHIHVVLGLADRVAVMHHGALLAIDSPDRIMNNAEVQKAYVGEPL